MDGGQAEGPSVTSGHDSEKNSGLKQEEGEIFIVWRERS
jgi:hypothetical protein